jgi:uncharacterized protein YmfQ (DUF2313 family)
VDWLRSLQPVALDRHVRRSGEDYAQALLELLPRGQAWPRDIDSTLYLTVAGLADYWGFIDGRAADLLERESDPRATIELLPDWERNWGLPDPCFSPMPLTISDRHRILILKMTLLGAQSREFYINWAAFLGYTIYITEYAPFMCGVSMCGDTSAQEIAAGGDQYHMRWYVGPPELRFFWTVHVQNARLTWFRCDAGQCGVDHLLTIGLAQDLECMIDRWKPAHTVVVFDYSSLVTGGSMAGTP